MTNNKLNASRREHISALATTVVDLYSPNKGVTDLSAIVKTYGIGLCHDDYGASFDGMLTCFEGLFDIHVDVLRNKYEVRRRFTIAHELGHFFLDEHRRAILSGASPHYSKHTGFASHSIIEQEADLFAGCLLAPESRLRHDYNSVHKFSPIVIRDFAARYQCSFPSMLSRFIDLSLHPIMRLTIRGGEIESTFSSDGFHYRLRDRRKVPEDSYLFDILQGRSKCEQVHQGYVADWFNPRYGEDGETPLFEYYRQWGNVYYGLIWEP